jgi:hypothetical protein
MKFMKLFASLAIVSSVYLAFSPAAAAKKEESLREKYSLPTHVQLRPFPAPTTSRHGRMVPITVFLEAFIKEKIGLICSYQPRVMDAIQAQLYQSPLKYNGKSVDLTGVSKQWLKPINQALGGDLVKSVHIELGARTVRKGSSSRLPFNASGCTGIKNLIK